MPWALPENDGTLIPASPGVIPVLPSPTTPAAPYDPTDTVFTADLTNGLTEEFFACQGDCFQVVALTPGATASIGFMSLQSGAPQPGNYIPVPGIGWGRTGVPFAGFFLNAPPQPGCSITIWTFQSPPDNSQTGISQ